MNIKDLQKEAYAIAKEKGWHDTPRSVGDLIALCHSELSEALESHREGWNLKYIHTGEPGYSFGGFSRPDGQMGPFPFDKYIASGATEKPKGFGVELADLIIRVADMAELYGIDLEEAIKIKMAYNRTRPYRHGGKAL